MNELATLADLVLAKSHSDGRGAAPKALVLEPSRALTPADLEALTAAHGSLGTKAPALARLRHRHHLLARLLAEGVSNVEASFITGYDQASIAILKDGPAFQELMAYYSGQESAKDLDFRKRLSAFGMSCVEELQQRLEESPEKVSWGQLKEAAEWALGAAGETATAKGASGASAPAHFHISFVAPDASHAATTQAPEGRGPIIDMEPQGESS